MNFLAITIAVCALWLALSERNRSKLLSRKLSALRKEFDQLLARSITREPEGSSEEGPPKPTDLMPEPGAAGQTTGADEIPKAAAEEPSATKLPTEVPVAALSLPTSQDPASARRHGRFDERSGSRALVWIGGVAIALAGIFLVKYSIDAGYLGPALRVSLGVMLGLALLGAGEWMVRRSRTIAQSLSAAGIADLYASLYAAVALYDLAPPMVGFTLMAIVTAGAIALALRQGPFIGLLGLAGGFLTPAIVGDSSGNTAVLLVYLYLIQAGTHVLVRQRGWWWLSAIAVAGGMAWAAVLLATEPLLKSDQIWLAFFLIGSTITANWSARRPAPIASSLRWVALGTGAAALLLAAGMVVVNDFSQFDWILFGSVAAVQLWFARADPGQEPLAAGAAVIGLVLLAGTLTPFSRDTVELLSIAGCFAALFGAGGYALMWGSHRPLFWASLSGGAPASVFALTYFRFMGVPQQPPWGWISLGLAAIFLIAAERVARYRTLAGFNDALGALALAVTLFVAMTVPLVLHHAWIGVAWSLQLVAMAWIEELLGIGWIRRAALAVLAVVVVRLLWLAFSGLPPALDWIVYGYGIPAAAFVGAARLFRRRAADLLVNALEGGAIFSLFLMLTLAIRQQFHGSELASEELSAGELAALVNVWLLLALGLAVADRYLNHRGLYWGNRAVAGIAMVTLAGCSLLLRNPAFFTIAVGDGRLINLLIPGYALPAVLLVLQASQWPRPDKLHLADIAGGLALVLGLAFISLEVRHWFQGDVGMVAGHLVEAENYSYSAVWIAYGGLLLVIGILGHGRLLRYASLAVIGAAICKVFLVDASALAGLYRVFSFLGLGLSLLLLAYLYQRFVFRRTERT